MIHRMYIDKCLYVKVLPVCDIPTSLNNSLSGKIPVDVIIKVFYAESNIFFIMTRSLHNK
jgi:hypothetical protein